MTIKNIAIETQKGRFEDTTIFTIEFVKHLDNPEWLNDENAPMYRTESMTETHEFNDKMFYRIQRFFKYEFQKTDKIFLDYNTIDLDKFMKIVKDVIQENHPVGLYLEGHSVIIFNERMARTNDVPVTTFKHILEYLEEKAGMIKMNQLEEV